MMRFLTRIDKVLAKIEVGALIVFTVLMVILTFIHVCLRMLSVRFGITWAGLVLENMDWSQPLVRLLVLWVTFVGASLVTRDDSHIKIDILTTLLHGQGKKLRYVCVSGFSFFISLFLAKTSMGYTIAEASFGERIFGGMPVWLAHVIVPVGFFAISFRFFLNGITGIAALVHADPGVELNKPH